MAQTPPTGCYKTISAQPTTVNVDDTTGLVGEWWYYPYGSKRANVGPLHTTYRYTGQRRGEDDLYWYRSRWYDSKLGRFAQPDTLIPNPGAPQNLNRYSYTQNNPLRFSDPTGHREEEGYGGSGQYACGVAYGAPCGVPEVEPEAINDIVNEMEEAPWLFQIIMDPSITLFKLINASLGQGDLSRDWDVGLTIVAPLLGILKYADDILKYADDLLKQAELKRLQRIADDITEWVGQGEEIIQIQNRYGDLIIRNESNTRRFCMDFNHPQPHQNPHMHIEWINNAGKWVKERIYPLDVVPR